MQNISNGIVAQKPRPEQAKGRSPQKSPHRQLPLFTPLPSNSTSGQATIVKQKLNDSQIQTARQFEGGHSRLNPKRFGNRIGLSVRGQITWKCDNCNHPWVIPTSTGDLTVWKCCHCEAPRLAQRQKTDSVLISELLEHTRLSTFEKTFIKTHSEKMGVWQRRRIHGFARRLGIRLEENCSLSDVAGVGQ